VQFGIVDFAFLAEVAAVRVGVLKCVERGSGESPGGCAAAIVELGAIRVDEKCVRR
jgi:hypothetical protein